MPDGNLSSAEKNGITRRDFIKLGALVSDYNPITGDAVIEEISLYSSKSFDQ